jgi:hypothetical protein
MWDGMIRTVIDVRYVPGVQRSLVSLSELDSCGHELLIRGRSMEILHGDKIIIRDTRRDGLFLRWSVRWTLHPLSYRLTLLHGEL